MPDEGSSSLELPPLSLLLPPPLPTRSYIHTLLRCPCPHAPRLHTIRPTRFGATVREARPGETRAGDVPLFLLPKCFFLKRTR